MRRHVRSAFDRGFVDAGDPRQSVRGIARPRPPGRGQDTPGSRGAGSRVTVSLAAFVAAAFFEIVGCYAFWAWLRQGVTPFVAVLGVASLVAFATALTRVDSPFAGRAYAAYGGIYIAASLVWLWVVEGRRPTVVDLTGAALAVLGGLVIVVGALRSR